MQRMTLLSSIPNFPVLTKCTRFTIPRVIATGLFTKKETRDHLKYLLQAINEIPPV